MKYLLLFLCLKSSFLFAQTDELDYEIYSAILAQEMPDTIERVVIRKKFLNQRSISGMVEDYQFLEDTCGLDSCFSYQKNNNCYGYLSFLNFNGGIADTVQDTLLCLDTRVKKLIYQLDSIHSKPIRNKFSINQQVIIKSNLMVRHIFRAKKGWNWERFYRKYPKSYGIIDLSPIAYTENEQFTLFYFGYQKYSLNGLGRLIVVDLRDNQIKVHKTIELWVS